MTFKPEDYGISANYQHWIGDKAEDHIGPFFFYMDGENPHTAFRVQEHNCNAHDSVHGGVLMSLADYSLCLGANGGTQESVATISCNSEFVAPAFLGDLILGRGEVIRRGRSIVFSRCELRVENKIVLIASAVIKRIQNK